MTRHNLPLQLPYSTSKEAHYDWDRDVPCETLLGYVWEKENDTLKPDITLSHGRLKQGLKGLLLKDNPLSADSMSKHKLLCILSSLFDPLGVYMSILRLTLKAVYSTVCLSIPGRDKASFDRPISSISPELARVTTDLCNQLSNIDQILPMKRNFIPKGNDVAQIILS